MSPASLAKRSFRTVEPVSRLRLSAAQTRHYPRCVCNVIFRSHRHELTNTTHDMNQKRSLFYSVVFMSKTIVFRKRYHELKMGHFGEIRLADPVFSAVVLPTYIHTHTLTPKAYHSCNPLSVVLSTGRKAILLPRPFRRLILLRTTFRNTLVSSLAVTCTRLQSHFQVNLTSGHMYNYKYGQSKAY